MIENQTPLIWGAAPKPQTVVQKQQEVKQQDPPPPPPDPEEIPDNLFSNSFARLIDTIGEGEIEGLVDRSGELLRTPAEFGKGIFINETPLMNSNGKWNFHGVKVGMVWGTQDQGVIAGFGPASETISSGSALRFASPVSIEITNPNADRVEVAVRFNAMLTQDVKTGNVNGSAVAYRVDVSLNGGAFVNLQQVVVRGKTRNQYLRTTSHKLPHSETPETDSWTVRVVRITGDATNLNTSNDSFLDFVTVYTKHQYRYPNTALVASEVNARGFQGIPSRAFRVRGLRVRVPNTYFPATREYNRDPITGEPVVDGDGAPVDQVWNGGFYTAWSNNPAWCYFDLITNTRYGLGKYMGCTDSLPNGNVDKWTLYTIARYCDELVDDGFGIMEPRFTCNVTIQSRDEAWKVVQDMASTFRGIVYWMQGSIVAVQDRPRTNFTHFTNGNVVEGVFSYSGTAKKVRHTAILVRWNDPEDFYRPKYEYVENTAGILRYGFRQTEIAAFGCTSRGQAHRAGRWNLLTDLYSTQTIGFKAAMEGVIVRPGDTISVMDNNRAGVALGGRIVAVASDRLSVTLDRTVTLPAGECTVSFTKPAGFLTPAEVADSDGIAAMRTSQITEMVISNAPGDTVTLTFATPIPEGVVVPCVFVIKTPTVEPSLWQVITIEETEPRTYTITALQYNPSKFDAVELDLALEEPDISDIPSQIGDVLEPTNITLTRTPAVTPAGIVLKISVSWDAPPDATIESYLVEYRLDNGNWQRVEETNSTSSEFIYQIAGTYDVKVTAVGNAGTRSDGVIATIVIPNTNPIELVRIAGLELVGQANGTNFVGRDAKFQWRLVNPNSQAELGSDDEAGQGFTDPYFEVFEVSIWDVAGNVRVYREEVRDPSFAYTFTKNQESPGGPRNQFRIEVRALDKFRNASPVAAITVLNQAPGIPTHTGSAVAWRTVYLEWRNPADVDLVGVEVWQGTTDQVAEAELVATVAAVPDDLGSYTRTGIEAGLSLWFWLRAVDSFGNKSDFAPDAGMSGITGSITATDIASFAVDATKLFLNAIVLTGDLWEDNLPSSGYIRWNAHKVVFRGTEFAISASNTEKQFVWWRGPIYDSTGTLTTPGETDYRVSDSNPKDVPGQMLDNDFVIATNAEGLGVHNLAWRGFANAVIGSAMIMKAAIKDAHIDNLSAAKLRAGQISGQEIVLADTYDGPTLHQAVIRSLNFIENVSGWRILGNGVAEFNDLRIRRALDFGIGYENAAFPGQIFGDMPTFSKRTPNHDFGAGVPVDISYVTDPTTTLDDESDGGARDPIRVYSTAGAVRRAKNVIGAVQFDPVGGVENTSKRLATDDLLFTGIALNSTLVNATTKNFWNLGPAPGNFLRRRLGNDGCNAFLIRISGEAVGSLSVFFALIPAPTDNEIDFVRAGTAAAPWNRLFSVGDNSSAVRLNFYGSAMYKIMVPSNMCIVFGWSPLRADGTTANDVVFNGCLEVTALNVGPPGF